MEPIRFIWWTDQGLVLAHWLAWVIIAHYAFCMLASTTCAAAVNWLNRRRFYTNDFETITFLSLFPVVNWFIFFAAVMDVVRAFQERPDFSLNTLHTSIDKVLE